MTSTADFWVTMTKGKMGGFSKGFPPHELYGNQFAITKEEYDLLYAVWGDLDRAERIVKSIRRKIKAHERKSK